MPSSSRKGIAVGAVLFAFAALGASLRAGRIFDMGTARDNVVVTGNLIVPRFSQTATLLTNGRVLIAGGMPGNGAYHATVELYDPAARRFTPAGSMKSPRSCHTATLLPNGKVLLAGGADGSWNHLTTAELYDPSTGKFAATGRMTSGRCGAAAVLLPNGKVLIVGGDRSNDSGILGSAELYDPATGTFSPTGSMQTPRAAFAAVLLKNGKVLVAGGASAGRFPNETIEASAELYDPATGRFTPTGRMATPRYKLAAVLFTDGRALIVGGSDNRAWRGEYSSAETYDPASGRFSPARDMNFKRYKLPMAVVRLGNGRILIAGGAERAEVYDPVSGSFLHTTGSKLDGFCFSTATLLPDGSVLIAGGYGSDPGAGGVSGAWLYRP